MDTCQNCGAKCCRYLSLEIDKPKSKRSIENIRWFVSHRDVWVYKHKGAWHLAFDTPCGHLDESNRCTIYEKRPAVCRDHDPTSCEDSATLRHDVELRTIEEVDEYAARRKKKRKKKKEKNKRG